MNGATILQRGARTTFYGSALVLATMLGACSDDAGLTASDAIKCPSARGEFGPSACAIINGVARKLNGEPLHGVVVRVDSINPNGDGYSAAFVPIRADGRFSLTVVRIPRLGAPSTGDVVLLDTARVTIKAYRSAEGTPACRQGAHNDG